MYTHWDKYLSASKISIFIAKFNVGSHALVVMHVA